MFSTTYISLIILSERIRIAEGLCSNQMLTEHMPITHVT